MTTAPDGAEMHYPKKLDPVAIIILIVFLGSLLECLRHDIGARILGLVGAAVCGFISFFSLRKLYYRYTGQAWLKLSREGLSFRLGKAGARFAWRDIKGFSSVYLQDNQNAKFVGIALNEDVPLSGDQKTDKAICLKMTNGRFDGILLPDDYGWNIQDLIDYLNGQKARYDQPA